MQGSQNIKNELGEGAKTSRTGTDIQEVMTTNRDGIDIINYYYLEEDQGEQEDYYAELPEQEYVY